MKSCLELLWMIVAVSATNSPPWPLTLRFIEGNPAETAVEKARTNSKRNQRIH
ncbi:hypothetical protein HY991_03640 [Candidatus Micrarchaeota archaeon]|nr:hypothetical protein [Candidatus Micrarchaeota archaeon]